MGAPGTVAGLVDHWVKRGRLPDHLRTAPKPGGTSRPVEGALTLGPASDTPADPADPAAGEVFPAPLAHLSGREISREILPAEVKPALRKTAGHPAHEPTEATRREVRGAAARFIPHDAIVALIGVTRKTLTKHHPTELAHGSAVAPSLRGGCHNHRRLSWRECLSPDHGGEAAPQLTSMPASLTKRPASMRACARKSANSPGVLPTGSAPSSA